MAQGLPYDSDEGRAWAAAITALMTGHAYETSARMAALHARGELHEDYHENLGAVRAADGVCCNFLRVHYRDLVERVKQGGTDEEILEWCFEKGRRLNEGVLFVWNGFASKLGWRDPVTPRLEQRKREHGISDRDDICTIPDFIDFDEGRIS